MSTTNQPSSKANKLIFAPGEAPPDSGQATDTERHAQAGQFTQGKLTLHDLTPDPFTQFHSWYSHPSLKGQSPETVTLSTASLPSGRVSSRMVYLKELDSRGWVIYSNWGTSRKSKDVASNPYAALCFWWKPLERQVRIEGPCERLTTEESQVYFDTRARGSRIGAWASQQSLVLPPTGNNGEGHRDGQADDGRVVLEQQVEDITKRFEDEKKIPVPEFWGGLRVIPDMVEFWQGRDSRLHDRFRYTQNEDGKSWKIERLSP